MKDLSAYDVFGCPNEPDAWGDFGGPQLVVEDGISELIDGLVDRLPSNVDLIYNLDVCEVVEEPKQVLLKLRNSDHIFTAQRAGIMTL